MKDDFCVERRTKRFVSELSETSLKTAIVFEGSEPAGLISFGKCRYGSNDNTVQIIDMGKELKELRYIKV